jgi:two-component system cell cycle sensor histidine kinase/response regulator CckA
VDSEPGRGTTFRLYFPAVDDAATPQAVPPAVEAGPGTETILLVEDNAHVRELVRQILATSGYTVLVAGGADEALLLEDRFSGPIDLVLSDVVMPGLSGRELYAELKARRPSLCVLFMSGYTEDIVADRDALGTGAGFLSKPFTREQLRAALRALLD